MNPAPMPADQHSPALQPAEQATDGMAIIFILGAPGAGKGTLCGLLAPKINAFHFSVGDHLREVCNNPSLHATALALAGMDVAELKRILVARDLVPPEMIVAFVKAKLDAEKAHGWRTFLVDGFPRSTESAHIFEAQLGFPARVLYFHCPRAISEKRFLERHREKDDDSRAYAKRYERFEITNAELVRRYESVLTTIDTSGELEEARKMLFKAMGVA